MTIDYKLIGMRIALRRKELSITQEQLAEKLDVSTAFISKIERGNTRLNLERLMQICQILNIPPADLLGGCDCDHPSYLPQEVTALLADCPQELLPLIQSVLADIIKFHKSK